MSQFVLLTGIHQNILCETNISLHARYLNEVIKVNTALYRS